jgi:hypothetical protein
MLNKKELQMLAKKDFGMFTPDGNAGVAALVHYAQLVNLTWPETLAALTHLANSDPDLYGEAMDTVVRECVYDALNFTTDFYV